MSSAWGEKEVKFDNDLFCVSGIICYKREFLVPGGWLLNFPVYFVDETWNYPLGIINSDATCLQNNGKSKLLLYLSRNFAQNWDSIF